MRANAVFQLTPYQYVNQVTGTSLFTCFDVNGKEVEIIRQYIKMIAPSVAYSTLESNFYAVKKFHEYLSVALDYCEELSGYENRPAIHVIIENYPFYLSQVTGKASELNRKIREKTGHGLLNSESLEKEISHINKFLAHSSSVAKLNKDKHYDEVLASTSYDLHKKLEVVEPASDREKLAMRTSSLMGAVIRQSENINFRKFITVPKFLKRKESNEISMSKVFPIERLVDLLNECNIRDRLLYTIMAGAGLRTHEVVQIRLEDFDKQSKLLVRSYKERIIINELSDQEQLDKYGEKGRATEQVFWLPGFEKLFLNLLSEYLKWRSSKLQRGGVTQDHGFLFVKAKFNAGEPLYLSSREALRKPFIAACERIGLKITRKHSLRHLYGFNLLNNVKKHDGSSFRLDEVQKLMGHKSISATQVYAEVDADSVKQQLKFSQLVIKNEIIRIEFEENKHV